MISAPYSAVLISFLAIAVFSTICGYVLARLSEPWRHIPNPVWRTFRSRKSSTAHIEALTDEEVWEWMDTDLFDQDAE